MANVNRDLDAYAVSFMGDNPDIILSIVPNDMMFGHTIHMTETTPYPKTISRTISAECYATPRIYELGVMKAIRNMYQSITNGQVAGQMSLFENMK